MKALIDTVIKYVSPRNVRMDDFVDRLCSRYTPILLGIFMFITGTVDTFGKPINCLIPQEFSSSWVNFVHQFCYVTGTYVKSKVDDEHGIPAHDNIRVHYYQWVPYVFIVQALLMRFPVVFWRWAQNMSDVDFCYVNELSKKARSSSGEHREEHLNEATGHIFQTVTRRGSHNGLGSLASYLYLCYKLMNVFVVLAQIYLLNRFVGYNSWGWGFTLFSQSWNNDLDGLKNFTYFPRVAYCEFRRDFLGELDGIPHEVRCTLGINMLNEKVFLCLYFWYYSLLLLSVSNAIFHVKHLLSPFRVSNIRSLLNYGDVFNANVQGQRMGENITLAEDETVEEGDGVKRRHIGFVAASTPVRNATGNWNDSRSSSRHSAETPSVKSATGKLKTQNVANFIEKWLGQDGLLLLRWVHQNAGVLVASELVTRLYQLSASVN